MFFVDIYGNKKTSFISTGKYWVSGWGIKQKRRRKMRKLICVVATVGVLMSLTAIPVLAGIGFKKWPKVETKYQGSKLCNQAIAEDCVTDQKSQNISVGLRKGSSVKASTNKTLHNYDKPMEIKSGFLETDLGYKDWNISTYWR